jgi:hypothetical protein
MVEDIVVVNHLRIFVKKGETAGVPPHRMKSLLVSSKSEDNSCRISTPPPNAIAKALPDGAAEKAQAPTAGWQMFLRPI